MAYIKTSLMTERNEVVPAIIRPADIIPDMLLWFDYWLPKMYNLAGERLFEDSHWPVPDLWEEAGRDESQLTLILEAQENIQGYIILKLIGYTGIDGNPCTYVPFIAAAPWNRNRKEMPRKFRDVGRSLISVASAFGVKDNGSFCIELHSLPAAEGFYKRIGMKETGRIKDGMKHFRLEQPEALALLRPFLATIR